jgi:hypothetical protein
MNIARFRTLLIGTGLTVTALSPLAQTGQQGKRQIDDNGR